MSRSEPSPINTQDAALNGARVLVSRPKRAWDAERTVAKRHCQHAGAWMRVLTACP